MYFKYARILIFHVNVCVLVWSFVSAHSEILAICRLFLSEDAMLTLGTFESTRPHILNIKFSRLANSSLISQSV